VKGNLAAVLGEADLRTIALFW